MGFKHCSNYSLPLFIPVQDYMYIHWDINSCVSVCFSPLDMEPTMLISKKAFIYDIKKPTREQIFTSIELLNWAPISTTWILQLQIYYLQPAPSISSTQTHSVRKPIFVSVPKAASAANPYQSFFNCYFSSLPFSIFCQLSLASFRKRLNLACLDYRKVLCMGLPSRLFRSCNFTKCCNQNVHLSGSQEPYLSSLFQFPLALTSVTHPIQGAGNDL